MSSGKRVLTDNGKIAMNSGGQRLLFDGSGQCPECCSSEPCPSSLTISLSGFNGTVYTNCGFGSWPWDIWYFTGKYLSGGSIDGTYSVPFYQATADTCIYRLQDSNASAYCSQRLYSLIPSDVSEFCIGDSDVFDYSGIDIRIEYKPQASNPVHSISVLFYSGPYIYGSSASGLLGQTLSNGLPLETGPDSQGWPLCPRYPWGGIGTATVTL